jgi:hypothetical protein
MTERNGIGNDINVGVSWLIGLHVFFILMYQLTAESHHFSELLNITQGRPCSDFWLSNLGI